MGKATRDRTPHLSIPPGANLYASNTERSEEEDRKGHCYRGRERHANCDVEPFLRALDEDVVDLTPRIRPASGMPTRSTGIAQSETASSAARITTAPPRPWERDKGACSVLGRAEDRRDCPDEGGGKCRVR